MPPGMTSAAEDHGPVIGGSQQLGRAPPSPPPPDVKGPGAGNLSGLVLLLAIFAAVIGKIAQKALAGRPTAAMKAAQKKATQMAAEMRNAAQNPPKKAKKELPKSKREKGSKQSGSSAKFSRLGTEEDAISGVDVEACGEEEDEDADENLRNDADRADFKPDEVPLVGFGSKRGKRASGSGPGGSPAKGCKASDNGDDAESGLCFGRAAASRQNGGKASAAAAEAAAAAASAELASANSYEESTIDFGGGDVDEDGEDDENDAIDFDLGGDNDNDDFDSDPDDDISPMDSVSNIGFARPISAPLRYPRAPTRAQKQRPNRQPFNAHLMTSVMEEEPEVMGLSQLNAAGSRNLTRRSANDDSFSVVHQDHMAMRARIQNQGDEMRVNLRNPATSGSAATRRPGSMLPVAKAKLTAPPPPPPPDDGDSDVASDVTFNFGSGGGGAGRDDDDHSDAASAVTFTFDEKPPPKSSARKPPAPNRRPAPQPPEPRQLGRRHQRVSKQPANRDDDDGMGGNEDDDDADSSATLDFGVEPKRKPQPLPQQRRPAPGVPHKRGARAGVADAEPEDDHRKGFKAPASSSNDDDDAFTSVALSSCPRDPYLGMKGGRLMGGGYVGPDGKWHTCGTSALTVPSKSPANRNFGDII